MSSCTTSILSLLQLLALLATYACSASESETTSITMNANCSSSCGGLTIHYPFGIGAGCFRPGPPGFEVICNDSKPFLASGEKPIEVSRLSIETAEASVMLPIGWQCFNSSDQVGENDYRDPGVEMFPGGVYRFSHAQNRFYVLGCNTMAYIGGNMQNEDSDDYGHGYYTGCLCYCKDSNSAVDGACSGVGCCSVDIPPGLTNNTVSFDDSYTHLHKLNYSPCDYAFLVEKGNYTFSTADLRMDTRRTMPVRLDWAIRDNNVDSCLEARAQPSSYACLSKNSDCLDSTNGPGYVCNCSKGYEGNPYVPNGCIDINECNHLDKFPCRGICRNTPGHYECTCRKGSQSNDPYNESCDPTFPLPAQIAVGAIGGLLIIAVVVFIILLRKEKRKTKEFFEKNGGPILEKVNNIKLFKKDDLKAILKSSNIIGHGGFGEVYKGQINVGDNNQLVAVKKPINVNLAQKDQFANEVIIQSRVIHKNIVKLIGCCLEVDIPILVYEFISKGSLDNILHGSNKMPLSLAQRLHIAAESAEGLAYMHSKTNITILHGDVKPANILLNDDLLPKISDFGISRLIAVDNEKTMSVIGDMSYMDPVYFQTGLLTNKSDVYSFGVVLMELITRKKASHSDNNSLLRNFLDAYGKGKTVSELIDMEIAETNDLELLGNLADLIVQCLNLDVDQRPEMTDVAERLHYLAKRARNN